MREITDDMIKEFKTFLIAEEKSKATTDKYIRDVKAFAEYSKGKIIDKEVMLEYKNLLIEQYAPVSVNSMLSSINSFFLFKGWNNLKVKFVKIQKQIFINQEKELTKKEYEMLIDTAKKKKNRKLFFLMQTICSTGIRVSELKCITVEAVERGQATINCKGKLRVVILPVMLCKMLKNFIKKEKIKKGPVFVSKNGNPLDRSNIWKDMKKLCKKAGVSEKKVFPHNLRHLFARTYYSIQRDVVRLADILGHSNVNTTRIYTMESGEIHRNQIQKLGLLRC